MTENTAITIDDGQMCFRKDYEPGGKVKDLTSLMEEGTIQISYFYKFHHHYCRNPFQVWNSFFIPLLPTTCNLKCPILFP